MASKIVIDGSIGEGGGQVLRTALSLSAALGIPFKMHSIRANRKTPGLKRQHLAGLKAAAQLCDAKVEGAHFGSEEIEFVPDKLESKSLNLEVGSGGSIMLVLQTILAPAARAVKEGEEKTIFITGGTYCPGAPSYEFYERTLQPLLWEMGYGVTLKLYRHGSYSVGYGMVGAKLTGPFVPKKLEFRERGDFGGLKAKIVSCGTVEDVIWQEKTFLSKKLSKFGLAEDRIEVVSPDLLGKVNAVVLEAEYGDLESVFTSIGAFGHMGTKTARQAAGAFKKYAAEEVPVCENLADQLLVPMTLAAGGKFLTGAISPHTSTCADVIEIFTGRRPKFEQVEEGKNLVTVFPAETAGLEN